MSRTDDYRGVSTTGFVDQDVERLISGRSPRDPELATLTPLFATLRSYRTVVPSIDAGEHLVAHAADTVRKSQWRSLDLVPVGPERPDRRPSWLPTRAVAAMLTFVLLIGVGGVVFAANLSIPGDTLYQLDLALEEVGIGDGSFDERLGEADALMSSGDETGAIALWGETLELAATDGEGEIATRAQDQLERVALTSTTNTQLAREKVEELRVFIEENKGAGVGLDGDDFSRGVTEIARGG